MSGTLPVHLAEEVSARGGPYLHLVLELPPERRGLELTAEEMGRCGARLGFVLRECCLGRHRAGDIPPTTAWPRPKDLMASAFLGALGVSFFRWRQEDLIKLALMARRSVRQASRQNLEALGAEIVIQGQRGWDA